MTNVPTRLPEFPSSLRWLERPPCCVATGLRGHVAGVLLWRLGCVHSRQALAELASLPREFAGRAFAAIAVHTPVEPAEHDDARLRRVLDALAVPVTVAVDAERALASLLAVASLPTLVLVDVDGTIAFCGRGEPVRLRLVEAIESLLRRAERAGTAARVPFATCAPVPSSWSSSPRLAPRAIAVDGEHLWVAAAGHRRIYVVDRLGRVVRTIGSGKVGADDGEAAVATFHTPNGLCVHGGYVVVSDAGTHTLRAIDRATGAVATWCGTGRRSTDRLGGGFGDHQGLCSPAGLTGLAALAGHGNGLYFAQAGGHQVWQFDPDTQAASAWLGNGERSLRDGGEEATFAEPFGLAATETDLFVADAGNGALRRIDLGHNFVRTVVQSLARPTAVAVCGDAVFVAASWQPAVWCWREGAAASVWVDAAAGLVEPVGLAVSGAELWLADVGADCLFTGAPEVGAELRRVTLSDVPELPAPEPLDPTFARLARPVRLPEFADVTLHIALPCGPEEQLDTTAPCEVDLIDEAVPVLACDRHVVASFEDGCAVLLAPIGDRGPGTLRIRVQATVRVGPTAAPRPRRWLYVVSVEVGSGGDVVVAIAPAT